MISFYSGSGNGCGGWRMRSFYRGGPGTRLICWLGMWNVEEIN